MLAQTLVRTSPFSFISHAHACVDILHLFISAPHWFAFALARLLAPLVLSVFALLVQLVAVTVTHFIVPVFPCRAVTVFFEILWARTLAVGFVVNLFAYATIFPHFASTIALHMIVNVHLINSWRKVSIEAVWDFVNVNAPLFHQGRDTLHHITDAATTALLCVYAGWPDQVVAHRFGDAVQLPARNTASVRWHGNRGR